MNKLVKKLRNIWKEAVQEDGISITFEHPNNEKFFQFAIDPDATSLQTLQAMFDFPVMKQNANTKEDAKVVKKLFSRKGYSLEKENSFDEEQNEGIFQCELSENADLIELCSQIIERAWGGLSDIQYDIIRE